MFSCAEKKLDAKRRLPFETQLACPWAERSICATTVNPCWGGVHFGTCHWGRKTCTAWLGGLDFACPWNTYWQLHLGGCASPPQRICFVWQFFSKKHIFCVTNTHTHTHKTLCTNMWQNVVGSKRFLAWMPDFTAPVWVMPDPVVAFGLCGEFDQRSSRNLKYRFFFFFFYLKTHWWEEEMRVQSRRSLFVPVTLCNWLCSHFALVTAVTFPQEKFYFCHLRW